MDKFFIYLLESGICLSMFYLGYVILFRKETYFTFNRIYLLVSVVLSVGIPMVHWGVNIKPEAPLAKPMQQITEFKYTYEKLISLTDPDFAMPAVDQPKENHEKSVIENASNFSVPIKKPKERWFRIILGIYFAGLVFFSLRLIYLLFWLFHYSGRLEKSTIEGVHVIQVPDKLPSFSFFNYVFINKSLLTPDELAQVIAHEKVHVRQRHSIDLLIAHVITIFQWFNPLVWRIQKSMKTVHEYLADREVLRQGFELFDYQSLLLSQLISIRSVELVNNFNLLSIKKRIAMMNKIQSGFTAKLKALFAIPIITAVFLLFANFTFDQSDSVTVNEKSVELTGMWKSVQKNAPFAQFIEFEDGKFHTIRSIKANSIIIDDYALKIKSNRLILHSLDNKNLKLRYELSGDHIRIWWDENTIVEYIKSPEHHTYIVVGSEFAELKRPQIVTPRKLDYNSMQIRIFFDKKDYYINEKRCTGDDFESVLKAAIAKCGEKEQNIIASLDIHADAQMKDVNMILTTLINNNILKIGYIAEPIDKQKYNDALYGIARLLPPKDKAFTLVDQADLEKKGIKFYKMDISKSTPDIQGAKKELKDFISGAKQYVIKMVYGNNTNYNTFVACNDVVETVIADLRNAYAQSMYSKDFESLSEEKQDEVKEIYPMALITAMK